MIIVSQDKDVIVNFERINYMEITKKDDYSYSIYLNFADSDWKNIGDYRTEERAKEILIAIMASYQANKIFECIHGNIEQNQIAEKFLESGTLPFRYEMPEE